MLVSGLQEIDKQRAFVQDVQIPLDVFESVFLCALNTLFRLGMLSSCFFIMEVFVQNRVLTKETAVVHCTRENHQHNLGVALFTNNSTQNSEITCG